MNMLPVLIFGLIVAVSCVNPDCLNKVPLNFYNFEVYHVTPRSAKHLDILRALQENPQGYDFWTDVTTVDRSVNIMVPPHLKYNFYDLLSMQNLEADLWINNVQKLADNGGKQVPEKPEDWDWKNYYTLETIYAWLDLLVEKYPGIVTPLVAGHSYEGRPIKGVKVSFGSGKKGAFIEGGIHAREWIAPAVVTYILNELLTSENPSVRAVAESRDWHIFPNFNPDGYVYTQIDRWWRKTRKPYGNCVGADPNRNWDYYWGTLGASNQPCSILYAGSEPFSEPETKALSEYINSVADTLDTYLAFHSFSQFLLLPFAHQGFERPDNFEELMRIGNASAESLNARYGTQYDVGNVIDLLGIVSGISMDWAAGTHRHLKLVYTYELRDKGDHGFALPPDQIIPSGEETFDSVVRLFKEADGL